MTKFTQGSASPNPARTKPPKNPTFLAGLRFEPCSGTTKGRASRCPFAAGRILRYRARLCEPEPRPHELAHMPALRAGLRFEPCSGTKKGSTF